MAFNIVEILQGLSELSCPEVALAKVHFEPHSLHLVDASLITAGAKEEIHGGMRFLKHIYFGHLLGTEGVEGSVGRVKDACLLKELHASMPVSSSLVDLAFDLVEFDESGCVLDGQIYVVKSAFKLL